MAVREVEINGRIRDREVRLISETGEQLGIVSSYEANRIADERNLDLVKINSTTVPPVCKIMDYGKYKFDLSKKEKDARRASKQNETKEVWLSITIETHDLETKAKQAMKFLVSGDKVKTSIKMKGRQQARPEFGFEVMRKFYEILKDVGQKDDRGAYREGRNIVMYLLPLKKPAAVVQKPAPASGGATQKSPPENAGSPAEKSGKADAAVPEKKA